MKNIIYIGVIAITCLLGVRYFKKPAPVVLPKYEHLSCIGNTFDLKVKFQSSVYLLEKALPSDEETLNILYYATIHYQNLYPFTNIPDINLNGPIKWNSLGSDPKIKILSIEDAPYPISAEFEKDTDIIGFTPEQTMYLQNLFTFGEVTKDEAAKKIIYEYENDLKLCLTVNSLDVIKDQKFPQPADPYLAYFSVPIVQRREITNSISKITDVVNPCISEGAISREKIATLGYWYHWRPYIQGADSKNVSFDCSLFYQEGKGLNSLNLTWLENPPVKVTNPDFEKFKNLERPIYASVHFGAANSTVFPPFDEAEVKKYVNLYLSEISLQDASDQLPARNKKFDLAFSKITLLLWSVKNHMNLINTKVEVDKYHVVITLQGKLKLSKKDLELKLSLSRNHPGKEGSDYFASSFANDLLSKDILIYDGHAAYGGIFEGAFRNIQNDLATKNDELKYQLLALYSCSSAYYFDSKRFSKATNPEFKRDLIQTGGGYQDVTSNSILAVLSSIDGYLYNKKYVPFAFWANSYKSDNFYILSNH